MRNLRVCSSCNASHSGPLGRRCTATGSTSTTMAEAFPEEQASNGSLFDISQEVIDKTAAQLVEDPSLLENVACNGDVPVANVHTATNVSTDRSKGNDVNSSGDPILNALQNISSQFQMFQQQAAIDRARVGELFEQFQSNQSVSRKQKTPHKKNTKKQTDVVIENDVVLCERKSVVGSENLVRNNNILVSQQEVSQEQGSTARREEQPVLMTYNQFLALQ